MFVEQIPGQTLQSIHTSLSNPPYICVQCIMSTINMYINREQTLMSLSRKPSIPICLSKPNHLDEHQHTYNKFFGREEEFGPVLK